MNKFKSLALLIAISCFALPLSADSTLDRLIDKNVTSGLNSLGDVVQSLIPGEGDTEVSFRTQDNYDLMYSILAVRPIVYNPYPQLSNEHLYFTQLRFGNHEPYANGDQRHLINVGLGFRTLMNDNNAILGANVFYDRDDESHERGSFGVEFLANNFEVYANIYDRLSDSASYVHGNSTITEEVLNGYDYSLVGQVPYMPWAKAVYKGYKWDATGSDTEGYNLSLEAQLFRGLILEYGRNKPDNQATEDFASLTFRFPSDHLTPTIVSHGITEYAFSVKNMKNEMLHKVRRTNNIITEKNMGGVFIARSQ